MAWVLKPFVHLPQGPTMAWIQVLVTLVLVKSWSFGLELHLLTSQSQGIVVFNASLGTGWTYSFDRKRSTLQAETLFSMDGSAGLVTLRSNPSCDKIVHNPFSVYVNCRHLDKFGYSNYTVTPLRVYIHGKSCSIKYSNKLPSVSKISENSEKWEDKSQTVFVSVQLQEQFGTCLSANAKVLSVHDYLPQEVTEKCVLSEAFINNSPDLSIDLSTGDLNTRHPMCLKWPSKILLVQLDIAFCGTPSFESTLLLKLMLYPKDFPMFSPDVITYMDAMLPQRRLRRQAGNTPPRFPQRLYLENVQEEQNPGYVINMITANDPDTGDAGRLTYSLLATKDGRSQDMFTIDPASGQLTTVARLDRENMAVHYFQVTAMDHGEPSQSGTASLTVYVDDINDHAPHFESDLYERDISESVSVGTTVLTLRASDEDSGTNAEVEYTILNPSGANAAFRIEPRLGSIVVRQPLDREVQESYSLEIQASDKALVSERKTATSTVELTIVDENDNRPQFSRSTYTVDVSEDIDPSGSPVIAEIQATDRDAGANGMVRYSITSGNIMNTFSLDAITGQLSVRQPLDFERNQQYRLSVRAQDNGSPYKSNSTTVLVRVIDVNDNAPTFYTPTYHELVLEDEPVGYTVIRVQAYDSDYGLNSALIYTIQNAPDNLPFEVDQTSGVLTIARELDREERAQYDFSVEARDQGDPVKSASARIEIRIRDINDNAPIFEPRVYSEVVSENANPGTVVLGVTARDRDENARVTYTLEDGNTNYAFSIDSQMGQGLIRVARMLNYQEQSRYILTVKASDGRLEDTATVLINISDANTYRPLFQGVPYQIRIPEDKPVGSSIYKVYATDNDVGENARVKYILDNNDAFIIDSATGEITIKHALDREKVSGYTISITATDHGRPPQSDSTDIEISVEDVNDNFPKFLEPEYIGHIEEGAFIGTSVLTLHAEDEDTGLNGRIRYTFEGGNSGGGDFRMDPVLGIVRVNKEIDRERIDTYELQAFAVDRGTPEKSSSVQITIIVDDINDNAPQFETSDIDMFIRENSPIGSQVGTVRAVDPDAGSNSEIEYSIHGGEDADSFRLSWEPYHPATISTNIELDYEGEQREYKITVRARSAHLFSDAEITIHVQDTNDNVPQLQDFVVIFNNYKDHFPTGEIGKIPASDPDEYDELRYRFVAGNQANIIHLNEQTGHVRLDPRLNSDVPTNATLQVSVFDGINEVKKTCRLFVRLVTEEMLTNSTTVRLHNIDHRTFLSVRLYDMFVSALASIIPTSEDNIFVINVQDDTDVSARVLNVSFAVRSQVIRNEDVFYDAQFLREKVYLQRALLAKLSTLEVLPFDDNLCLMEPCFNFDECTVIQKFGNASGFLGSETMLFRPIHPINQFECSCPKGFTGMSTGYLCDTEVNLCYSAPCGVNGTCMPHEGGYTCHCKPGFTGGHCDVDMVHARYDSCPPDVCALGFRCVPLIRGGFRCEDCADDCTDCADSEHRDKFCGLKTRSFDRGSFLMFPSLKRRHRFTIKLSFATREKDGLLFYNGRYNEKHDFVAMEIIGGQVQFSFSLGSEVTRVRAGIEGGVHDGNWHSITVEYYNKTATLSVGEACDTEISIQYGDDLRDECAARVTQHLEDRCADPLQFCHRFLDLTGPFQLGGVPTLPTDFQVQHSHFSGCIRDVYIDENFLDLDSYVFNNRTETGCANKEELCQDMPCKNEGVCTEGWGRYLCECTEGWGGKDCSQRIEAPSLFSGNSYLLFDKIPSVTLPWFNGVAFRTHQMTARVMTIKLGSGTTEDPIEEIHIDIVNGIIQYVHPRHILALDGVDVNDGKWHYLEARWLKDPQSLALTLDYRQYEVSSEVGNFVASKKVGNVYIGGHIVTFKGQPVVNAGFVGCIKDVRVGNSINSVLSRPERYNIKPGCQLQDPCEDNACPLLTSECVTHFGEPQCSCHGGRRGPECHPICERYNPCQDGSECRAMAASSTGYTCVCDASHEGEYCERPTNEPCPSAWWGQPICGPCNCPVERGFDASCNKLNGECTCREHHYRPGGGDTCYPCDCYSVGSLSPSCDMETGYCQCKEGVINRRCDACTTKFAEVTLRGCELIYDDCPRAIHSGIWWPRTPLNRTSVHDCPSGAVGQATRFCDAVISWHEPNLVACVSRGFVKLREQLRQLDDKSLKITAFLARNLVTEMNSATGSVEDLYLIDLNVTYAVMVHVLAYEKDQSGLNLTHKQDRNFIQNIVNTVGRLLEPKNAAHWQIVNQLSSGTPSLLYYLEQYSITLAKNMHHLFMQPFDVVHANIVFGLDTAVSGNLTNVTIPKYNNKVRHLEIFDHQTNIVLPSQLIKTTSDSHEQGFIDSNSLPGQGAVVAYVMFKTLGDLLPQVYGKEIRKMDNISLSVNSPVFTINVINNRQLAHASELNPVVPSFMELTTHSRTSPQCVFWKHIDLNGHISGKWSKEGCSLVVRKQQDVMTCSDDHRDNCTYTAQEIVTCRCQHMTSFAVIMDISVTEYATEPVTLEIATYVGVSISLACLFVALVLFCCLRNLNSNMNSIHLNLTFSLLVAQLIFLVGINQTEPEIACRVVAILLCYFYLCSFFWMFVETLHLYRMLTEVRNIDVGAMKFYFVLGYVIPGIIVGLAVGLETDQFGNDNFCWLKTDSLLIWSFAGPICFIFGCNVAVYIMALRASCQSAKGTTDYSHVKLFVHAGLVLLPLLGVAWVFALLSINEGIRAFHYLFAIFTCLEGIFILLAYVIFCKKTRRQLKYQVDRLKGKADLDDSMNGTRASMLSRSALAYQNESSLDGGLTRLSIGVSTNSTTSRSTSKNSSDVYRQNRYLHSSSSTSTSANIPSAYDLPPNAGIAPYGWRPEVKGDPDTGEKRRKRRDSDSDSELSAVEHPDLELASSHSSDDDEDDDQFQWGKSPKNKKIPLRVNLTPLKKSLTPTSSGCPTPQKVPFNNSSLLTPPLVPPRPKGVASPSPVHSTPTTTPPFYHRKPALTYWSGDSLSSTNQDASPSQTPQKSKPRNGSLIPSDSKYSGSRNSTSPTGKEQLPSPRPNGGTPSPKGRDTVTVISHNGSITESETGHETTV